MTDYGRGQGSEPWHPQDPHYGDQGWGEDPQAQPPASGSWDDPYGTGQAGQPQQPSYPEYQQHQPHQQEYPQHQQPHYPHAGQQEQYPQHEQYSQQEQYPQPHQPHQPQYGQHQQDYGSRQQHRPQQPYPGEAYPQPGAWDPTTGQPYAAPGTYGGQQPSGYDTGEHYPDPYGTDQAYPPPRPQHMRADPAQRPAPGPDPETGWDPGPDQGEEDFFTRRDDDRDWDEEDEDEEAGGGRAGRRRTAGGSKPRKRRGGCACLGVALLLVGGVATAGYYGKQFYDSRFGAPEDYAGEGTGEVQVEIPEGATLTQMGNILKEAGVVKSVGAFTRAAGNQTIQPGYYTLRLEMSAAAAVETMTDPATLNTLTVPEGLRASRVYEAIDAKLGLEDGTTADVAASGTIELPDWADDHEDIKDPLEGFLFPARYDIGDKTTPESLLQAMVDRASARYAEHGVEDAAAELGLDSPLQVVAVASLVQAEGMTDDDFRMMSEVIYNRLQPDNDITNRMLQFDSTYNYLMNQSELKITEAEILGNKDPYNTYVWKGLPPGPIGNPGDKAIEAALNPTADGWMFFITLDGTNTEFTKTHEEHEELRKEFNERQGISGG